MPKAKPKAKSKRQYNPRRKIKPAKALETPPVVTAPRPVGRPSEYGPHVLEITTDYYNDGYKVDGHSLPMQAGLCMRLGCTKETLRNWAKANPEFLRLLDQGHEKLEMCIANGGITGKFHPTFTGLVAANTIGWRSSKSDVALTSPDGSMTPKAPIDDTARIEAIVRLLRPSN